MMNISLILQIVISFMKIAVVSFGGGYAAIGVIQKEIVDIQGWMSVSEFSDVVAIDEITPGPIAINCATFVGTKMAGIAGAVAATFGYVLPCAIISLIMIRIYYKYRSQKYFDSALSILRCMVVALLAYTTISIFISANFAGSFSNLQVDYIGIVLTIVGIFVLRKYKINPLYIILASGFIGTLISYLI